MVTQQTALSTAKAFINDCKAIGLTFNKVLLFGSYAHGIPHEGSDIDLLLVSESFTDDVFANLKQYSRVNIKYPLIETHPYPLKQYMEGDEFISQIALGAVEIW